MCNIIKNRNKIWILYDWGSTEVAFYILGTALYYEVLHKLGHFAGNHGPKSDPVNIDKQAQGLL
jgi:hypothetical protein